MRNGQTIKEKSLAYLKDVPDGEWRTASQVAGNINERLDGVSSILHKMATKTGELERAADHGPRGGFGYRIKK